MIDMTGTTQFAYLLWILLRYRISAFYSSKGSVRQMRLVPKHLPGLKYSVKSIKRGEKANDYWSYCQEVGCDVWGMLTSMHSLCGEPVCLWLPEKYQRKNTSEYVQGVEVTADYNGAIPDGFEVITLPAAKYLMFQGEPFNEEDYCNAIEAVQNSMEKYDPSVIGYAWDKTNPHIQLELRGERGYIELKAIHAL